jgi:hypothetical protein
MMQATTTASSATTATVISERSGDGDANRLEAVANKLFDISAVSTDAALLHATNVTFRVNVKSVTPGL